jgi:hypothetical protein
MYSSVLYSTVQYCVVLTSTILYSTLTTTRQKEKENSYELNITVCQWKRGQ